MDHHERQHQEVRWSRENWTCELRETGQSRRRDQHELTQLEHVFGRKRVVQSARRSWCSEEAAEWRPGINLQKEMNLRTRSWYLILQAVSYSFLPLTYLSHFLPAKGGQKYKTHRSIWASALYLSMFFLIGKVVSVISYYDGQFQDHGYQLWLYTTQSVYLLILILWAVMDTFDNLMKIWALSLRKRHLHKKFRNLIFRTFILAKIFFFGVSFMHKYT